MKNNDVLILTGAGAIGMAIARRIYHRSRFFDRRRRDSVIFLRTVETTGIGRSS